MRRPYSRARPDSVPKFSHALSLSHTLTLPISRASTCSVHWCAVRAPIAQSDFVPPEWGKPMGERRNNDCQQNGQTREQAIRPRPGPEDQATPDRRRAKGHMAHGLLPAGRVPSLRVPWGEQQPRQRNGSTCFICSTVLAAVTLVLAKRPGPVPVVGGQRVSTLVSAFMPCPSATPAP